MFKILGAILGAIKIPPNFFVPSLSTVFKYPELKAVHSYPKSQTAKIPKSADTGVGCHSFVAVLEPPIASLLAAQAKSGGQAKPGRHA